MPIDLFSNSASTTLAAAVTTTPAAGTAELWTVAATGSFPQIGTAQVYQFRATVNLANDPNPEIVIVQQLNSASTMTVLRGAEGSPVKTHANGVAVSLSITAAVVANTTPSGTIKMFGGPTAPVGWLICDGSAVSRTTYSNLWAALQTAPNSGVGVWGNGDGSTTFNLPDLRGRSPIGAGLGTGLTTTQTLGQHVGNETHTLATSEIPAHNHTDSGHGHADSGHGHGNTGYTSANHAHSGPASGGGKYGIPYGTSVEGFQNTSSGTRGTFTTDKTQGHDTDHVHATGSGNANIGGGNAAITNTGGGGSHPITHPCAVVHYIIRV